jgi:hypothetical protein
VTSSHQKRLKKIEIARSSFDRLEAANIVGSERQMMKNIQLTDSVAGFRNVVGARVFHPSK